MRITKRLLFLIFLLTGCVVFLERRTARLYRPGRYRSGWPGMTRFYRENEDFSSYGEFVAPESGVVGGAEQGGAGDAVDSAVDGVDVGDDGEVELWSTDKDKLNMSPYIEKRRPAKHRRATDLEKTFYISAYLPYESKLHTYSFNKCLYQNCKFALDMSQADALLLSGRSVRDHPLFNYTRPPGQRWIFYTYDPSVYNYNLDRSDLVSSVNWTFTYQLHSTYPLLFGMLRRRSLPKKDYGSIFDGKMNASAWFVSHCSTWSKREVYVDRMKRLMDIHVFGSCGDRRCGEIHYRTNDTQYCLPMLSRYYKFYIAFENAFCKDYVTEKLFKLYEDVDIIPVVRGGFDYKRYLPAGTFVDATDFKSPEDLAVYLNKLGNNKQAYLEMLKLKQRWKEVIPTTDSERIHCHACEMLNLHSRDVRTIPNLHDHFNGRPSYCHKPADLGKS